MSIQENPFLVLQQEIIDLRHTINMLIDYIQKNEPPKDEKSEYGGMELAIEITHLSKPTIYRKVRENSIPYSRIGRRLIFSRTDLMKWIEDNRVETNNEVFNGLGISQKNLLGRKF